MEDAIILRKAAEEDCEDIYKWRNDERTRRASFDSEYIFYEVHRDWLCKSLCNNERCLYIGEKGKEKIGIVRLDKKNEQTVEFNINLAPQMRGKGYGSKMIELACDKFSKESDFRGIIIARTKDSNVASIKAFKKAGFLDLFDYLDGRAGGVVVLGRQSSKYS